jgi:hypothetical protein
MIIQLVSYIRKTTASSMSLTTKVVIGLVVGMALMAAILGPSLYFGLKGRNTVV